jgi:hypothetical protein
MRRDAASVSYCVCVLSYGQWESLTKGHCGQMLEETAVNYEDFKITALEKKTKITISLSRETYLVPELVYSTSLSIVHVLTLFQSLSNYNLLAYESF